MLVKVVTEAANRAEGLLDAILTYAVRHRMCLELAASPLRPGCKIADNSDPLRGIFAFNTDPF